VVGTSEEEMVERLVEHHRNVIEVRSFYQHVLKEINADQPKADVFSQGHLYTLCLKCTNATFVFVSLQLHETSTDFNFWHLTS